MALSLCLNDGNEGICVGMRVCVCTRAVPPHLQEGGYTHTPRGPAIQSLSPLFDRASKFGQAKLVALGASIVRHSQLNREKGIVLLLSEKMKKKTGAQAFKTVRTNLRIT